MKLTKDAVGSLYDSLRDRLGQRDSLVFEFATDDDENVDMMLYTVDEAEGALADLRRRRDHLGLFGRFEYESSSDNYADGLFPESALTENLERTLKVFCEFAAEHGFLFVESMGAFQGEFGTLHQIWVGNDKGADFSFNHIDDQWYADAKESLETAWGSPGIRDGNPLESNDRIENVVLYFGAEGAFELFYINSPEWAGSDEAVRGYLSRRTFPRLGGIQYTASAGNPLDVYSTPIVDDGEMREKYGDYLVNLDAEGDKSPLLQLIERIAMRVAARLECLRGTGIYADNFRVYVVFHDHESRIAWDVRELAAKMIDKTCEEYLQSL